MTSTFQRIMEYGIQTLPSSVVSAPSSKHNHVTEAPPPVEDHGYKMINRVKQEPDEHNKLSTSSIAECREDINIGDRVRPIIGIIGIGIGISVFSRTSVSVSVCYSFLKIG